MKCLECPVLGPDYTCIGERGERLCFLGRTDPRYARSYRELAGEIDPLPPLSAEQLDAVNRCPHRSCQDGCLQARCGDGKGRGADHQVDPYDCLDCLATVAAD